MCALVDELRSVGGSCDLERVRPLKRIVPKAAIRKALQHSRRRHGHCRKLSREFVVWFVIVMTLFCRDNYRQVFRWLVRFRHARVPGRSTLCEARHRIGVAPLQWLAQTVIELLGTPQMPQAFYAGMRLMAIDGFVVDLRDTPANERTFGRPGGGRSPGAFPQARVVSLCEVGTHVLWRSRIKPLSRGEVPMARIVLRFLCRLPERPRSRIGLRRWYGELLAEIAAEKLEPRRDRVNPRVITRQVSPRPKKREIHGKTPQPQQRLEVSIAILD